MVLRIGGSSGRSTLRRTSSRKLGSSTSRWSINGPPSESWILVGALASPSGEIRRKYGWLRAGRVGGGGGAVAELLAPGGGDLQVLRGARVVVVRAGDLRADHQAGDLGGDGGRRVAGGVLPAVAGRARAVGDDDVLGLADVFPLRRARAGE